MGVEFKRVKVLFFLNLKKKRVGQSFSFFLQNVGFFFFQNRNVVDNFFDTTWLFLFSVTTNISKLNFKKKKKKKERVNVIHIYIYIYIYKVELKVATYLNKKI